jgi:hypothetical protein
MLNQTSLNSESLNSDNTISKQIKKYAEGFISNISNYADRNIVGSRYIVDYFNIIVGDSIKKAKLNLTGFINKFTGNSNKIVTGLRYIDGELYNIFSNSMKTVKSYRYNEASINSIFGETVRLPSTVKRIINEYVGKIQGKIYDIKALYYINRYYTRDLEPEFITEDLQ